MWIEAFQEKIKEELLVTSGISTGNCIILNSNMSSIVQQINRTTECTVLRMKRMYGVLEYFEEKTREEFKSLLTPQPFKLLSSMRQI